MFNLSKYYLNEFLKALSVLNSSPCKSDKGCLFFGLVIGLTLQEVVKQGAEVIL